MQHHFISRLAQVLDQPLPGFEAQLKMSHPFRRNYPVFSDTARSAAVLILFYQKAEEWHIPLIHRSSDNPKDRHSGQISFPGGRLEKNDKSLMDTALREAEEEIGISAKDVIIIGKLSEIYIPISNFLVHPFVGHLNYTPEFSLQPSEVKDLLEAKFQLFLQIENIKRASIPMGQNILTDVPYFDVDGQVVWGATAMILSELVELFGNEADSQVST
jgi:8-oxo-dGTP pyrophosphatase MutT (NUDIX family)